MLLTDENIDIWYREYQRKYRNITKYVKRKHGELPENHEMASRREFDSDFRRMVEDHPNLSGSQIAKKMAQQELYIVQYSELRHVQRFSHEEKMKIMVGADKQSLGDLHQEITRDYHRMIGDGISPYAAKLIISNTYYGSE